MDPDSREALHDFTRSVLAPELDELARVSAEVEQLRTQFDEVTAIFNDPRARRRARVRAMYLDGLSTAAIATSVGVAKTTVFRNTRDLPAPASSVGIDGVERKRRGAGTNGRHATG